MNFGAWEGTWLPFWKSRDVVYLASEERSHCPLCEDISSFLYSK
jgi:hypothetical protein